MLERCEYDVRMRAALVGVIFVAAVHECAGQYSVQAQLASPRQRADPGIVKCLLCEAGRYQPYRAGNACVTCGAGTFQRLPGDW